MSTFTAALSTADLPLIPNSRELRTQDKALFDAAFRDYPPEISEFTFSNLFSWAHAYAMQVGRFRDWLVLKVIDQGKPALFPPIGPGLDPENAQALSAALPFPWVRLTGDFRKKVPHGSWQPDPDNFDYLYRTQDLIELKGAPYDGKRNLIKKFKSSNTFDFWELEPGNLERCWEFQTLWCRQRHCDEVNSLSAEQQAIRIMFDHFAEWGLVGGAIEVAGRIVGVAIAEPLNPETLVLHVQKALPELTGLYQTLNHEFLRRYGPRFPYVNFEQDLGVPGLRKAKQSYHPLRMIEKFIWTPHD